MKCRVLVLFLVVVFVELNIILTYGTTLRPSLCGEWGRVGSSKAIASHCTDDTTASVSKNDIMISPSYRTLSRERTAEKAAGSLDRKSVV